MEHTAINFDTFELSFLSKNKEIAFEENIEEPNHDEIKQEMESLIPKEAFYIGSLETEIENWAQWTIEDDYYIIPLIDDSYDWALFRISWDDNFGNWDWCFDARLTGLKQNYKAAARLMIAALWKEWNIDVADEANITYSRFLNNI